MEEWLEQLINEQLQHVTTYEEKALLETTKTLLDEQQQRIEQLQGEIDGRLWNHKEW